MRQTQQEHEEIERPIVTYHILCANFVSKITVCYFVKKEIPHQTNFLPKSGRSSKLVNKDVQTLVRSVSSKTGISQLLFARRFDVHLPTISRALENKTTVKIYIRKSLPKYRNENKKSMPN